MGIDIFARWKGQSDAAKGSQVKAWLSTTSGARGYLREAYHGGPYATKVLCAEAFQDGAAQIPAAVLRARLDRTLELARERERALYASSDDDIEEVCDSYRDFVALCEEKERTTGEPVLIVASF